MPQLQFPPALMHQLERVPTRMRFIYGFVVIALAIVAYVGIYSYGKSSGYVNLYATPLTAQQLAEVTSHLAQDQIPYESTADNVSVPASKKGDELLRFATEGVPHSTLTTSADVLKQMTAMTPTVTMEEQKKVGLAGDIASNLRGITGVIDASVILALAQPGTFVDEPTHDASASVHLKVQDGYKFPPQAITGMRAEVASAVPGLSPDHVTITDQSAMNLADAGSSVGDSDAALESKLNATLTQLFGAGNAWATVNVETEGSASTSHEIKHVPLADKPIATDADREHYVGKNKSYDKVHENTDRGSDTVETSTQTAAGGIRRKAVAVFINSRIAPPSVDELTKTIGAVAGIDTARGDTIQVQSMAMAGAPGPVPVVPVPAPTGSAIPQAMLATFAGIPWPILILLLLSVGAVSYLGWLYIPQNFERKEQLAIAATTQLVADEFEPVRVHAALRDEPPHVAAAILATLSSTTATAVLELYGPDQRREIVKRLTKQSSPVVRDVSVQAGRG